MKSPPQRAFFLPMSSRCSRLGISGLNSPALLCRFAGFVRSGVVVVCRVRLWVLWLSFALRRCRLGVFVFQISRRPSQAVLLCSELWSLLSREGAHRATLYFILAPFSAAAAAFFRSRKPFSASVPLPRSPFLFRFFFCFRSLSSPFAKKNPHFGDFFCKRA